MRIIIVEDSPKKFGIMIKFLEQNGIDRDAIVVSQCADEARIRLSNETFDILFLDILLPHRPESVPSRETSYALLKDVTGGRLRRPRVIVGLTAHKEAIGDAQPHFDRSGMRRIVEFDETSNAWQEAIESCLEAAKLSKTEPNVSEYNVDICIICALPNPETKAIEKFINWDWKEPEKVGDSTFARRGTFSIDGRLFTCVLATASRMGMVATAVLSANLIEFYRPRFLVMAGICAGIRGKTKIGDLIVGDPVWDYQSGKRVSDKGERQFAISPHQRPLPEFIRSRVRILDRDHRFLSDVQDNWTEPFEHRPSILLGPIGTGSSVVADEYLVEEIKEQHRGLTAIEMESYGLYEAAALASYPRPTAIVMKSVCDFADERKDDSAQAYASYVSATVIREFFTRFYLEIRDCAGTT